MNKKLGLIILLGSLILSLSGILIGLSWANRTVSKAIDNALIQSYKEGWEDGHRSGADIELDTLKFIHRLNNIRLKND